MSFGTYASMIEDLFASVGIDPISCRSPHNPNEWILSRGSATVVLFLRESEDHEGKKVIMVLLSPMLEIPKDEKVQFELAKRLLSLNHLFINERFTESSGWIYLMAARPVEGLDSQEIMALINSLTFYADLLDDKLKEEFGTKAS